MGLSSDELTDYERGLVSDHRIRVQVSILDLDYYPRGMASDVVLSGQVDFHTSEAVDRSCSLVLLDPDNALGIDDGDPNVASAAGARMVQVRYGVWSSRFPHWVDVPVFTGPITKPKRVGDELHLTAHGYESKLLGACSLNARWPKGGTITDVIRAILALGRVARMEIPDLPTRTRVDTVIGPTDSLWDRAQGWARALGWTLAFDGLGVARLTPPRAASVWTFRGGDAGSLLGVPEVETDLTVMRNIVVVQPEKGAPAVARLPASHPQSYENQRAWMREDISAQVPDLKAAQALADAKLKEYEQAARSVQLNALPVPHLEPRDRVTVVTDQWTWAGPVHQATIPLVADGQMTIGHHGVVRRIRSSR